MTLPPKRSAEQPRGVVLADAPWWSSVGSSADGFGLPAAVGEFTVSAMMINIQVAWVGLLLGCLAGAIPGLFFHQSDWLGGYASWQRRMIRLAHIAFFGIGVINLSFALTARALGLDAGLQSISILLIVGAVTMPTVCYLSAWKPAFRNLFFIPAMSLTAGIALFVWRIIKL